jgi:hypothetical protein
MNGGILYGSGKELRYHEESRSIQFIRDVVCPDSAQAANLFWLTNKYLYLSGDDSIINRNYGSRLFVFSWNSGNVVCIPGELGGVRVLKLNKKDSILKDTILFSDMAFRPESSLRLKDTLFLGGQSGIIAFKAKGIFDENNSLKYHYVEFKDKEERQSFAIYLSFLAALIIVIIYYVRYRVHKVKIKEIKRKRDKLNSILEGNAGAAEKFNDKFKSINEKINKFQLYLAFVKEKRMDEISNDLDNLDKEVHEFQNEKIKEIKQHTLNEGETFKRKTKELYVSLNRLDDAKKYISNEQLRNEIDELKGKLSNYETGLDDELNRHIQTTTESVTWYLIERINDQINKIVKVDERSNLIKDSKSAIEQKDIGKLLDAIRHNEEKLKEVSQKTNKSKLRIEKYNPSSNKPRQTMTFKINGESGVAEAHLTLLYEKLVRKEKWIEGNEVDFKALFSGKRDEECELKWKGVFGKGTLVELFKQLIQARLIEVAKGYTISSILEGHFKDMAGVWLTGLDKGNAANDKALPVILECIKILNTNTNAVHTFDDDEDFQAKYDPWNHQDLKYKPK